MKKLVLALVLMISINAFAQDLKPKQKQKVEATVDNMAEVMELSADQKAKILDIKIEQEKERIAIVSKTEKGSDERKAAFTELYKKYGKKQKEIVTPEQQKKWKNRPKE
ncbi:hypothetical protein [Labilibacter marinus]|uniref:hypothetical protein n=1 Tax=Labilibacter marinus TaxID=1477105 RepID=UPI0008321F03|nr:hypothetical protein [Labilibacter marinus]